MIVVRVRQNDMIDIAEPASRLHEYVEEIETRVDDDDGAVMPDVVAPSTRRLAGGEVKAGRKLGDDWMPILFQEQALLFDPTT